MAKYGISKEGADALIQLASDMSTINDDIEQNGRTLKTKVESLDEGLGVYKDEIIDLIAQTNNAQEKGRESVEILTGKIKNLATQIQTLVSGGLGK